MIICSMDAQGHNERILGKDVEDLTVKALIDDGHLVFVITREAYEQKTQGVFDEADVAMLELDLMSAAHKKMEETAQINEFNRQMDKDD